MRFAEAATACSSPAELLTWSSWQRGFDCPALNTVFLVFPMKFKGRVVQYVGRVLRPYPSKTSIEVHDYVDVGVPVLAYAHTERCAGYASLGFALPLDT
jgi:predicted helicase